MGNPAPGFSAVRERPSGQDDLILDENRLNGAAFSGLTAGIFEIIGNVAAARQLGRQLIRIKR